MAASDVPERHCGTEIDGYCRDKVGSANKGRYDEECLYNQRVELLGLSSSDAEVFHLPLGDHVH
jgi:hypothetical protein